MFMLYLGVANLFLEPMVWYTCPSNSAEIIQYFGAFERQRVESNQFV